METAKVLRTSINRTTFSPRGAFIHLNSVFTSSDIHQSFLSTPKLCQTKKTLFNLTHKMQTAFTLLLVLVASVLLGSGAVPTEIPRSTHLKGSFGNKTFAMRQGNAFCVPKVPLKFAKTTGHGGTGGSTFDDLSSLRYDEELEAIEIRSAARIDKISFKTKYSTYEHGGNGGTESRLKLRPTDKITQIKTCIGTHNGSWRVFFLGFKLRNGITFNNGQTTSTCYTRNIPSDKVVVAGHGRAASELDKIGFVLRTPMC